MIIWVVWEILVYFIALIISKWYHPLHTYNHTDNVSFALLINHPNIPLPMPYFHSCLPFHSAISSIAAIAAYDELSFYMQITSTTQVEPIACVLWAGNQAVAYMPFQKCFQAYWVRIITFIGSILPWSSCSLLHWYFKLNLCKEYNQTQSGAAKKIARWINTAWIASHILHVSQPTRSQLVLLRLKVDFVYFVFSTSSFAHIKTSRGSKESSDMPLSDEQKII